MATAGERGALDPKAKDWERRPTLHKSETIAADALVKLLSVHFLFF